MNIKPIINTVLFILFLQASYAKTVTPPPQVAVSPSRFEITYGKKMKTYALTLINYSDHKIKARISLSNWTLEGDKIKELPPTPQSLDQWMLITPLNVRIAPHGTQTIRFAIRPRTKPTPGEHRAMIWIDQIQDSQFENEGIQAKFRFGVAVYLYVPPISPKGKLQKLSAVSKTKTVASTLKFSNNGNVHDRFNGTLSLWKANSPLSTEQRNAILSKNLKSNYLISREAVPSKPLLPKTQQTIKVFLKKPKIKGPYILYLHGTFKNGKELTKKQIVIVK